MKTKRKLIEYDDNGEITSLFGGSLQGLAHYIGYKNIMPREPKETAPPSCMNGYYKRFNNWHRGLMEMVKSYEEANGIR